MFRNNVRRDLERIYSTGAGRIAPNVSAFRPDGHYEQDARRWAAILLQRRERRGEESTTNGSNTNESENSWASLREDLKDLEARNRRKKAQKATHDNALNGDNTSSNGARDAFALALKRLGASAHTYGVDPSDADKIDAYVKTKSESNLARRQREATEAEWIERRIRGAALAPHTKPRSTEPSMTAGLDAHNEQLRITELVRRLKTDARHQKLAN